MINKIISTFHCGSKAYYDPKIHILRPSRYLHYRRIRESEGCRVARPHLIEVFGSNFTNADLEEIYKSVLYMLHPLHGRMTINGEFLCLR